MEYSKALGDTPYTDLTKSHILKADEESNVTINLTHTPPQNIPINKLYKTPHNLHPMVLMIVYSLVAILTGGMIYGWPYLGKMYEEAGLYNWLCTNNPDDPLSITDNKHLCAYQRASIEFLYTIGIGSGFFLIIGFGVVFSRFGPRVTGTIAGSMCCLACFFVAVSTKTFQLYIPAMMMLGILIEVESLCIVTIRPLFPKNEGLIIGIIMSCLDLSWSIPGLMYYVYSMYDSITISSMFYFLSGAIALPCTILLYITLPSKLYTPIIPMIETTIATTTPIHTSYEELDEAPYKEQTHTYTPPKLNQEGIHDDYNGMNNHNNKNTHTLNDSESNHLPTHTTTPYGNGGSLEVYGRNHSNSSIHSANNQSFINEDSNVSLLQKNKNTHTNKFYSFIEICVYQFKQTFDQQTISHICDINYITFSIYFGYTNLRNVFFMNATKELIGDYANDILGIAVPFSFIPSLLSGFVLDWCGMGFSKLLNNAMGSILYIFALFAHLYSNDVCSYFAVFFYVAQNWNFTLLYGYIADKYGNTKDYGILVGISCLLSGLVTVFSKNLYHLVLVGPNLPKIMIGFIIINTLFSILFSPLVPFFYEPRTKKNHNQPSTPTH